MEIYKDFIKSLFPESIYNSPKVSSVIRKWKHFVQTGNVLTILLGNDLDVDLWSCPSYGIRTYTSKCQKSMSRVIPSKIVKTLLVLTKCFHFLLWHLNFNWKYTSPQYLHDLPGLLSIRIHVSQRDKML